MAWNFDLVAGPYKGRTGGLAWDGRSLLFSAVQEERILRFDPGTGMADVFRKITGRTNGIAVAADGTVFGAQEGGRRVVHFLKDGSTAPTHDLLDGKHHNQPADVIVDSKGRVWIAVETLYSFVSFLEFVFNMDEILRHGLLGDGHNSLLDRIEHLLNVFRGFKGVFCNFSRGLDQIAEHPFFFDDFGVILDVRSGRHLVGELC